MPLPNGYYARNEVTFDGLTNTITVPYDFIDRAHNVVSLNDVALSSEDFVWTSDGLITLDATPGAGVVGRVQRATPIDDLLAIVNSPGTLKGANLNLLYTQLQYCIQEALDAGLLIDAAELLPLLLNLLQRARYAYSIEWFIPERFAINQVEAAHIFGENVQLLEDLPLSSFWCQMADPSDLTQNHVFGLRKVAAGVAGNGSQIGTITVAAPSGEVTAVFENNVQFNAGDRLLLVTNQDGNVTDMVIHLRGYRTI